jgi:hypothetical protein
MGEDKVDAVVLKEIEKPGPGGAGLDHSFYGAEPLEEVQKAIRLGVGDTDGFVHKLTDVADNGDHGIRCMSIDSCDEHGWPPWVWRRRFLSSFSVIRRPT